MLLGNAYLAVDTFFLVGGFLLSYGFFREMKKGTPFDVIKFYLYRYIRFKIKNKTCKTPIKILITD